MIGILVVSHSVDAARGIALIASQMSGGGAFVRGVGGTEEGGLGTSVPQILEALTELLGSCDGVVVVPDLGSAVLSARTALELLDPSEAARVAVADAPALEGAMMGAVESSLGSDLAKVVATAEGARNLEKTRH